MVSQLKSNKSMATYFHGNSSSQIQPPPAGGGGGGGGGGEGLQTLLFMNPTATADYNNNVGGYSDSTQPTVASNFVFLNSDTPGGGNVGGGNSFNAPPSSQLLGIPLASAATSSEEYHQNHISLLHGFLPRFQYNNNLYNNNNQKVVDHMEARETTRVQRGLSLSLSSQLSAYGANSELPPPSTLIDDMSVSAGGGGATGVYSSPRGISNGVNNNGMQNHDLFQSSKYLRAAQQLLDELVNVGDSVIKRDNFDRIAKVEQPPPDAGDGGGGGGSGCEKGGKRGGDELTTTGKQEIQMKKAKLVNMLDEVEQRYRQYHQQMQMVARMFEEAGGIGSAKAYTALALQTISKQFRSIKDAILCQVRIASKSLGDEEEDEDSNLVGVGNNNNNNNNNNIKGPSSSSSSSRMKNIDNQLRQQRALQQLGMVHHNAWRPQRGLPERSVSVLRSWLFEHFLHPYPKDSDKIMLAKQAGLTRGQVSNWFINARVRLWKPMVEKMYSEEMKQQEKNGSEEKSSKNDEQINNEDSVFKTTPSDHDKTTSTMEYQNKGYDVLNQDLSINNITNSPVSMSSTSQARIYMQNHQTGNFGLIESPEMESISNASPKKQRCTDDSDNEHLSMKFDTEKQRREDGFTFLGGHTTHFINGGGFNTYPIAEHQFPLPCSGINGVSLSLGLPHCENLAMSGPHQTFLSNENIELARGVEEMGDAREFGSIPHRVIVPEYMRESTFRNTRGLMDNNYYQTL